MESGQDKICGGKIIQFEQLLQEDCRGTGKLEIFSVKTGINEVTEEPTEGFQKHDYHPERKQVSHIHGIRIEFIKIK